MWSGLAGLPIQVLTVGSLGHSIVIPEQASLAKLGNKEINDILEGAGLDCVCLWIMLINDSRYNGLFQEI